MVETTKATGVATHRITRGHDPMPPWGETRLQRASRELISSKSPVADAISYFGAAVFPLFTSSRHCLSTA